MAEHDRVIIVRSPLRALADASAASSARLLAAAKSPTSVPTGERVLRIIWIALRNVFRSFDASASRRDSQIFPEECTH